ncbi:bifunctional diaminohydroxyphosphoribosylaminopyrimidine deaminase/5-amino-6-(5-phosphoribosylamino)uracil reductase RibD [Parerythrobacter jejuensis]|uniref:Riboflavin biosynthesis protein RibD n=1 Tax=Parerythrobacter jejuensis TaxID=795812 RepID=A0A845AS77_9SPHN|nr:bifunctional diaminohydroxyphosphoribosylaminopyrimidine deaminase/5-amino-6-(5-phosphoribosylamino)uracil reductase RibD [Parerythrobacter jejuensis]MXP31366.1 bifunctional diaminohydroxyphosphoribosylaminopyrimidine deaminase/5-amino-6-(5-phosphoribosylamino)uracil reductase RibD [Parerythrobacter jejuensis]MXP34126.1 bifunctional diaminohydroxyphosphoribosylaminopyrimidine deaminase/5-amino-6-(5-phosphoribosylamino)uracil reductase RibD [Parerythrobacter jejuensis]
MESEPTDLDWLDAAAALAGRGRPRSSPNPAVGCILVKDGVVVGRGWTQPGGRPHAEAQALGMAGPDARGAVAYVTLEPCAHRSDRGPSCADLLVEAAPARVVVAQTDPDPRTDGEGIERLKRAGITVDYCDSIAARRSLDGFLTLQRFNRPHVTLKLAMSLDGCIALPDGESQWITGEEARAHVHSRRAMADAILVGGGTWRKDLPRLTVRLPGLEERSPQRVVLTRGVPIDGVKIINTPAQICTLERTQYLYVEGGAQTGASFLAEDLVDRLEIYRAPIVIGKGMPSLGDIGLTDLAGAHGRWRLVERRQLGSDCYEAYERIRD